MNTDDMNNNDNEINEQNETANFIIVKRQTPRSAELEFGRTGFTCIFFYLCQNFRIDMMARPYRPLFSIMTLRKFVLLVFLFLFLEELKSEAQPEVAAAVRGRAEFATRHTAVPGRVAPAAPASHPVGARRRTDRVRLG